MSQKNVFGRPLKSCSHSPLTGFLRNGCCETTDEDLGVHSVCAIMTAEFLEFSRKKGNDLTTPRPDAGFPGLRPGDRWCLCVSRWVEAYREGSAPQLDLEACEDTTLLYVDIETLRQFQPHPV